MEKRKKRIEKEDMHILVRNNIFFTYVYGFGVVVAQGWRMRETLRCVPSCTCSLSKKKSFLEALLAQNVCKELFSVLCG